MLSQVEEAEVLPFPRTLWCHSWVMPDPGTGEAGGKTSEYDPAAYGDLLGADYDSLYPPDQLETEDAVAFLAELAERHPSRSVLEFGIGTGRLALQLHRRGLRVAGIDASEKMVEALRQKASGERVEVAIGDYVTTRMAGCFAVVALVFNNILDRRGLPAQLALFGNAARHLAPGGCFVVEAFVLSDQARDGTWRVSPRYVGPDHVELQMSRFDVEDGTLERTLVHLRPEGPQFVTVRDRYSGPEELDVMAHVSGMRRIERYSSWARAPFNAHSERHITVYQRP